MRVLLELSGGSMAHFTLAAGETSLAVVHRSVEEIWFVVSGRGEMWRRLDAQEEVVALEPGVSVTIPRGTRFQLRTLGGDPLTAVAVTMPPWPGDGEACAVDGVWMPTVGVSP